MDPVTLALEQGFSLSAPVYKNERRAKNRAAIISLDPAKPGGLERKFLEHSSSPYHYYSMAGVTSGMALEFAAERRHNKRWYGAVVSATETALVLEPAPSGRAACLRAAELAPATPSARTLKSRKEIYAELILRTDQRIRVLKGIPNLTGTQQETLILLEDWLALSQKLKSLL